MIEILYKKNKATYNNGKWSSDNPVFKINLDKLFNRVEVSISKDYSVSDGDFEYYHISKFAEMIGAEITDYTLDEVDDRIY